MLHASSLPHDDEDFPDKNGEGDDAFKDNEDDLRNEVCRMTKSSFNTQTAPSKLACHAYQNLVLRLGLFTYETANEAASAAPPLTLTDLAA